MAIVVAEFDKRGHFVKRLDDGANLVTDEPMLGQVAKKLTALRKPRPGSPAFVRTAISQSDTYRWISTLISV